MIRQHGVRTIVFCLLASAAAHAQSLPAELARAAVERWVADDKTRAAGLAEVVREHDGRAVLLLSGVPRLPNSGDATVLGAQFSGVYEARADNGTWKLGRRIPQQSLGRITAHDMKVTVRPGSGLTAEDHMRIQVKSPDGFAVRLNHAAKIRSVHADGKEAPYRFGGGLLWVDVPPGETELALAYSIEVEKGPEHTNSACFLESSGHVRNQYLWHPVLDIDAAGSWADFHVEVRIPKEYRLTTTIPQAERVENEERITEGRSARKGWALTLVYDRGWKVETRSFGGNRVELFLAPDVQPDASATFAEFQSVYALLSKRFGPPPSAGYFAVVQARSWKDSPGWRFTSSQAIVAAMNPGPLSQALPAPRAGMGHEISHLWLQGLSGPAMSFLGEGWATWAESAILENQFGAETAKEYWRQCALMYFMAYDGKMSLLEDNSNSGISYMKGPWVYRMLENVVGRSAFDAAMAEYFRRSQENPAGWEVLAEIAQRHAPADLDVAAFLRPWLEEKRAPKLTAQIAGRVVTIRKDSAPFQFPVAIEAVTARGPERQRVWTKSAETPVTFSAGVSSVKIDPDDALLLSR